MSRDSIRRNNYERLANLVQQGEIVYACEVGASTAVDWKSCTWAEYWKDCSVSEHISERIHKLRES